MNCLKDEKKLAVLAGLVEGNSVLSVSRMTGVHKTTILSFLGRIGKGCEQLLDERMTNLECQSLQVDEIWCFVGKKQSHLTKEEKRNRRDLGDQYVFVALDAETKLVPLFEIGKRDKETTLRFMFNLEKRLTNHVQLTTDAFTPYPEAIDEAFGRDIDYAQLHKSFAGNGERRYSPPSIVAVFHLVMQGNPQRKYISTSHVERQNLTMRMQMRRFTRLTNGFSKKLDNLKYAVALHFAYYNFCRIHKTLRCTPAMSAGVTRRLWVLEDLLAWEEQY
ncbi:MAG: IS1 family transposase [Candidatus Neomarinimicrobiota bacterium]